MTQKPKARAGLSALVAGVFAVGLIAAQPALAQLSTSTIRGHVSGAGTAAAQVVARNVATGYTTRTATRDDGAYVLAGLPPGTYQIEVSGTGFNQKTEQVTVAVGQTAELDIGVAGGGGAAKIETITVAGNRLLETKTSEIATQVTPQQMERLPQVTRNFLAFADLAPGVQFVTNADGSTRLQGGAQSSASVNVYVDGVSQKNYVLQGGITGQDSSRGNPFPQSAIAEYRVITQNYKAEFDQVSSAAITAVTRSGANDFSIDGFYDHTSQNWRAPTPAEKIVGRKAESKQDQYGLTLGGPIIRDRMHYFFSYEGKDNKDPKTVTLPGGGIVIPGAPIEIASQLGPTNAPFKEDLFFGKLDWSLTPDQYLEASYKYRKEKENTNVGGQNTESYSTDKTNDEKRFDLKHQWTTDRFLNEAHLSYEDAYWSPRAKTIGNGSIYETGGGSTLLNVGGGRDFQNKGQKGWALQDDLTWSAFNWNGSHVVKVGAKVKRVQVDAMEQSPFNPQYHYDASYSVTQPYRVEFGVPLAVGNGTATSKNTQIGFYAQDDWEVNRHLTLNAGVRWDYEKSPAYQDYVTPADVVTALKGWTNINQGNAGFNINDFISTGSNRDSYKNEWQPRLGFSYDIGANQRLVVFGGYGRAYDRNLFDYLQLERTKSTFPTVNFNFSGDPNHPCSGPTCVAWDPRYLTAAGLAQLQATGSGAGREIDLVSNNIKVPYSDQFSIGVRGGWFGWQMSAAYSYIESKDGFAWLLGNRNANGSFFNGTSTWGAPFGSPIPGFGALLLGVSGLETRTNALLLSAEKPYSKGSGWGATAAYTYSDSKENRQFGEHYSLDYPDIAGYGWKPSSGVPKHRFVGTAIYDMPWGLAGSAKLTLSSHQPKYGTNCLGGFDHCVFDQITTNAYRQLDLALQKEFTVGPRTRLRIRADVINVFNYYNWDGYDTWWGAPGDPNLNRGHPDGSLIGPTRTYKLSVGFAF